MSAPLTASESAVMNWKPLKERMNCTSWYSSYKDETRLETKSSKTNPPAAVLESSLRSMLANRYAKMSTLTPKKGRSLMARIDALT